MKPLRCPFCRELPNVSDLSIAAPHLRRRAARWTVSCWRRGHIARVVGSTRAKAIKRWNSRRALKT